jgi:hypothetical protein
MIVDDNLELPEAARRLLCAEGVSGRTGRRACIRITVTMQFNAHRAAPLP